MLTALGTGCGEKQEPPAPEPLSQSEFTAAADEICVAAREQTLAAVEDTPSTPEQNAALTADLIAISEQELSELVALRTPASLEQGFDRYLAARQEAIEVQGEALRAARAEDALGFAEAQAEVAGGQVERTRLAEEAGLEECSRPSAADTLPPTTATSTAPVPEDMAPEESPQAGQGSGGVSP
ncbi:MAG: hypothetical protein H0W09_06140 [Solirubrobacterales bacterium]|nr:hypothetical protein [Solirubrobacterales bacterium]